jgi:hypothetical protein
MMKARILSKRVGLFRKKKTKKNVKKDTNKTLTFGRWRQN